MADDNLLKLFDERKAQTTAWDAHRVIQNRHILLRVFDINKKNFQHIVKKLQYTIGLALKLVSGKQSFSLSSLVIKHCLSTKIRTKYAKMTPRHHQTLR